MRRIKRILTAYLSFILAVTSLTGCNAKSDIISYVQYTIDLITQGESKGYIKLTKSSEEEAEETYETYINMWTDTIVKDEISDELKEGFRQFFRDLFRRARYEVKDSEKIKDERCYTVSIEVEQMKGIFEGLKEALTPKLEDWMRSQPKQPSDEEFNEAAYEILLNMMNDRMEDITYNEAETITVTVDGNDGSYAITSEGYYEIRKALLSTGELYEDE